MAQLNPKEMIKNSQSEIFSIIAFTLVDSDSSCLHLIGSTKRKKRDVSLFR